LGAVLIRFVVDEIIGETTPRIDTNSSLALGAAHQRGREAKRARVARHVCVGIAELAQRRQGEKLTHWRRSLERATRLPATRRPPLPPLPTGRRRPTFRQGEAGSRHRTLRTNRWGFREPTRRRATRQVRPSAPHPSRTSRRG